MKIDEKSNSQGPIPSIDDAAWTKEVMEFQGVPDFIPFESDRAELLPPVEHSWDVPQV